MKALIHRVVELVRDEDAVVATEYAVMLALIIVVALPAITSLGERVRDIFQDVSDRLPEVGLSVQV